MTVEGSSETGDGKNRKKGILVGPGYDPLPPVVSAHGKEVSGGPSVIADDKELADEGRVTARDTGVRG